ncbi:hypothetical protein PAAG_03769 [Paracoccidioides lutzii Pb01]|uniref:LysM domain-containing protein n=1 Tax=Paracoccidioides lutzii (strain ATCC MYA-826 / Pb01) TaxID=502779 RepID=C1GZ25_PARBA|nr:hypothetical protein PAAG_03769 [Paracoccidioides lutzii Pb01]EEH41848.2 hypothetical protein PAAG_03769 [Paracoccidioides lutzii Pb01]
MNLQAALCILAVLCVNGLPTGTLSFSQNPNSTCLETHTAVKGDTCDTIASRNGLTVSELQTINARLGDICASIKPGQNYCVRELLWEGEKLFANATGSVPEIEIAVQGQSAVSETVRKKQLSSWLSVPGSGFPVVQEIFQKRATRSLTIRDNDTCESIATVAGISVGELVTLNPVTLANCGSISRNALVCLGSSSSPSMGAAKSTNSAAPIPLANGRSFVRNLATVFLTPRKSP